MGPNYYVTPPPRTSGLPKNIIFIGIGLFVALVVGVMLLGASGGKSITTQLQHLSLRLDNTQNFLSDVQTTRNLKDQELSQLVTNASLTITSDINDLTPLMTQSGLTDKYSDAIIAAETDTTSAQKIEEAKLNNNLDKVYASILSTKVTSLRALIAETYNASQSTELRAALDKVDDHLLAVQKQLEKITL